MGLLMRLAMDKEEENKRNGGYCFGAKEDHNTDPYKELK